MTKRKPQVDPDAEAIVRKSPTALTDSETPDARHREPPLWHMFQVDLRALAAFRIGIGLVLIWDLIVRSFDLSAHYTDDGVLPRTALIDTYLSLRPYLSLHILNGTLLFEAVLFVVAGLFALSLIVGYRTRLASIACWFLTCSLHARNPLVVHGGDDILRMLLFWAMFVPVGARWSVDHARRAEIDTEATTLCSWGSAGLLLQLCSMYVFSGVLKSHPSWRSEGTAVFLALSIDQFATPIAHALLPYHGLLKVMTFGALALEMAGPFIALFSFTSARNRTLIVGAFVGFHIGLGLCLELGIFPAVCICGWLAFLPKPVWDKLERKIERARNTLDLAAPRFVVQTAIRLLARVPRKPLRIREGRIAAAVAGLYLFYILMWNIRTCNFDRVEHVFPRWLNPIGEVSRVDQYWNLFAPYPSLDHGWYVLDAHLRDGDEVDLMTGKPVSWERPRLISATYKNERWRKYLMNLWTGQFASHRPYYAQYLQRTWNEHHPAAKQVKRLEMTFVLETALPHFQVSPQQRVRIWSQDWTL